MASTYTTDLAIQLMATGENAGTWGQITNTNLIVVQQAIAGYEGISIAGGAQTTALVMTQNALATARNAVIKLTGTITGNQIVTIPGSAASGNLEKTWIVSNGTTGAFTVTFKYAGTGTGQTWSTTDKGIKILYADGSDIQVADLSTLSGTLANFSVATAQLATNAVTAVKITQSTITQAKLASNSVGATQIIQSTITQAKLAANSVGSNQLISTGVTAASYTAASITVDADGRITAASSGSGGAGMGIPTLSVQGPTSGTYTASPTANRIGVYMWAGGGGTGNNYAGGGDGGYGFYNKPITQPFSQPYAVGAGGNRGNAAGNAGGATNIANVGTVNGGSGGTACAPQGTRAPNGNAPGVSLVGIRTQIASIFAISTTCGQQPEYRDGFGVGGQGAAAGTSAGAPGALIVFENTGT